MSARMRWAGVVALLTLPPAAVSAEAIEIAHSAAACIPAERYARIAATASPAEQVASAELQFRGDDGGEFYSARMSRGADGTWSASLPRPLRRLRRVEYRIVVTGADAKTSATPVFAVEVGPECASGDSASEVAEPIVVRVPANAPPVPPVPPAFSPAGVVAAAGPPPRDKWRAAKWIAGAAAAAGVGAVGAGAFSSPPEPPDVPDFALAGVSPAPGGVLSVQRDRLAIRVQVSGEPATPLTFRWSFELGHAGPQPQACVTMGDVAHIGPERPLTIELSANLIANGFCGFGFLRPFDVNSGRLIIVVDGHIVHDTTHETPFHIQP